MFSEDEKLKMREAAYRISELENLEAQSWDDAWSGKYPEEPSEEQVESIYRQLEKMALDIKSGGDGYVNYDLNEYIRMMWLDDIFNT